MKGKKFKISTLGCRTNQYESEAYASQLRGLGYREVQEGEEADICIVNSCTVTESADRHSRYHIRQLHRRHPHASLVVTGCLAERCPTQLQSMEGVSHVLSYRDKEQGLLQVLPELELPEFKIDRFSAHTRAFVKIQDGCNSFCTYCIIPYVRGRSRSREIKEVVEEIKGLVANGYREVVLTGINIGDFKTSCGEGLADLVRVVDQIEGLERIRISSIDPDEVDDALISAILEGKKTTPSLHLVLQAGSNTILKRMNRKYTKQMFLQTVRRLKNVLPDFTFTTDVIIGFPGETETDLEETLEVMREVKFAKVHMFPFSRRPRTRAALYPNQVTPVQLNKRKKRLLLEAEKEAFQLREEFVGKRMRILIETENPSFGHSEHFLPVTCSTPVASNAFVDVECVGNSKEGLQGRVIV